MSFPAARVGDLTVTGDSVLPPGVPNVVINNQPAAVTTTSVAGPVINAGPGMIISGNPTVLIGGMPAAHVTSMVFGMTTTPAGSVPVSTTIAQGAPTVLIGAGGGAPPLDIAAGVEQMKKEAEAERDRIQEEKED
ncbi:PAAR domain-containing protein [Baaleninema sp.]|uniref:PAAR domain-containing protein n=1 Tax=Baaleninema sp. TaxID=3101197 RepID=UPI003D0752C4